MKRFRTVILIVCLFAGVALCIPRIRHYVLLRAMILVGLPVDDASARVPHIDQFKEYSTDDPVYDYLIYYFDGRKRREPTEVASAGIKAIRKGGFGHAKNMTLVIFCDLKATSNSPEIVYPFGLFLESNALRNPAIPVADLAGLPIIVHPMNWDFRINTWVFTTNNATKNGPDISENADYVRFNAVIDRGLLMGMRDLTKKAEVYAKFGTPRYYVREFGTYSEIYPINDAGDGQAGTLRVWYDAERVTNTGYYITNK